MRIERAVQRASRTSLDHRDSSGADLSAAGRAARLQAKAKTGRDGGFTGRELIQAAAGNFKEAQRLAAVARRRRRRSSKSADRRSEELLLNAAAQIRIASVCPLDRPYLHALTLDRIQTAKAEVQRAADVDIAALAVDTHRRIQDQRQRIRAEGVPT